MHFLVDENLPVDVAEILRGSGHDVLHVAETDRRGASDREIWQLATREARIIMTRDLDFPIPELPKPPGLILLRVPDAFSRSQIGRVVSDFVESEAFQQVTDTITVVSPGRVRARKL